MDSLVGKVISHYKIIERIGAGGMGVVYKAEDTKLGRIVALKFLPPEMTRDKKAKERFVQEARAASAIEHSSICTIFEVDEIEDDRIFISMAYYQGKTLKDRIAEGPLELREALDIASQAAHGLAKAHSNGIVHRDIKPGNIFITDDHEVKIVDFGLAKLAGQVRLTSTGKTMGTVSYMSPEQARGEESGPQTDIWALGVVLYEMVTGELPFKGDYDVAVVYSIMNETPPPMGGIRPGVPEELENIVKKALAKNQSERYQSVNELLADLSALKQQLDFSTFTGTSEWKFKNKGRRWIYAAGAVAIIVAVAAVVWLIAANRKHPSTGLPGKAHQVTNGDVWHGDPALSPDGGTIAYSAEDSGNADIYLINVTGGNPLRLADDRAADYYPAWFPDGSAIAFVSERGGSPSIWKVSQLGGGATLLVKDAIDPAIDPFGKRIAFAALMPNGDVRIGVAPLADPADVTLLTRSEDIAWEHRMPAWSPDGRSICFTTRSGLWIVLASGGPSRRLTTGGYGDQEPVWSSDGKYVYFSSAREGTVALWRVAAEGGRVERRTSGSSYEHNPTISRDGARMAYATQTEPGSMLIRDLSSGAEKKVLGMRNISIAAISPDASMLAYASDRGGPSYDLWLQPLERGVPTGQPQRLTDDTADASCPAFSPDGKWIAYHRILGDERDIFTISISGGKPIQFTNDPAQDTQPSWSHNGTKIVFASDRGGGSRIWVAPVSNGIPAGPPRPVTPEALMAGAPVWSHDGESIAFIGVAGGANDVYVIPADGRSPPERVTDGAGAMAIRWDGVAGSLLASGTWKEDTYSLRRITLGRRATAPIDPPVVFGSLTALPTFDVSFDGRFVVYGHESKVGNIWIHEAPKKTF